MGVMHQCLFQKHMAAAREEARTAYSTNSTSAGEEKMTCAWGLFFIACSHHCRCSVGERRGGLESKPGEMGKSNAGSPAL